MSEFHGNAEKREHHEKLKKAAETAQSFASRTGKNNVMPMPPRSPGHPKSHAINLESQGNSYSKPEGELRQGVNPGARRQP